MTEVIKKVKGFVNKKGDKFELEPSAHTHTCSEILGLDEKIQNALKEHSHDSILDAGNTESSVSISGGVLNISLDDPSTGTGEEVGITADKLSNLNRAISGPDAEPTENSNALITSGAVYTAIQNALANIGPRNVVSTLPNLSEVSEGDEYLYIGQSAIGKEFGQTYKCESKLCGDVILSANSQDEQELDGFLNHAKTMQTVTGGKYIMTGYSYEQNVFKLDVRIFPNSASVNFTELTTNVLSAFNASAQEQLDIDQYGDNSATVKKVWTPKYKQELIPFYQV